MARLGAPVDPYCIRNGVGVEVKPNDKDENLATLTAYARKYGVRVWRYDDDKIGLTSKFYDGKLGSKDHPQVFGREGGSIGETAHAAFSKLYADSRDLQEINTMKANVDRQGRNTRLDPVDAGKTPLHDIAAGAGTDLDRVVKSYRTAPGTDEVDRDTRGRRVWHGNRLIPMESAVRAMGKLGHGFMDLVRRRDEMKAQGLASLHQRWFEATKDWTPEENAHGYADHIEKGIGAAPGRAAVLDASYAKIHQLDNEVYDVARSGGIDVAEPVRARETNPTGAYFPHMRDFAAMNDPDLVRKMVEQVKDRAARAGIAGRLSDEQAMEILHAHGYGDLSRDNLIQNIIKQAKRHGTDLGRDDAERLLDSIVQDNTERVSPNLQKARQFDATGYMTDAKRVYNAKFDRDMTKIADHSTFGPGDEKLFRIMDQMASDPSYTPRDLEYMRQAYDHVVGNKRINDGAFVRMLKGVQRAKLSLSFLPRMFKGLDTVMFSGLKPFSMAARDAVMNPRDFTGENSIAVRSGALQTRIFGSPYSLRTIDDMSQDIEQNGMRDMMGAAGKGVMNASAQVVDKYVDMSTLAFRFIDNFNRAMAQRTGEYSIDQMADVVRAGGMKPLMERRLLELDISPKQFLTAVQNGDKQALGEMRTLAGIRTSNITQFQNNYRTMPLWASNSELGHLAGQFKNYSIGQTRFMIHMLSHPLNRPDQWVRAVATIAAVYPVVGMALGSIRQDLVGPTLSGQQIATALEDPTFVHMLAAGATAMTLAGGLGIVGDMGATAVLGNSFDLDRFVIPPAASSMIDYARIMGGTAKGIINGDPNELKKARAATLRQFGGFGGAAEQAIERQKGEARPAVNPLEAYFGR